MTGSHHKDLKRENKDTEVWDREAIKTLKSKSAGWFSYYIGSSYRIATRIGLKLLGLKNKINLLKVDLWNEGIESQRDILGQYQNHDKINLYGVDISDVVCSYAKLRLKSVNIIQGDIRNLPFKNSSFDILLDLSTLDHVPETQAISTLREYERVLKKGAILVLIYWYCSFFVKVFKVKHIIKAREKTTQYYFSITLIKNNIKGRINIIDEYYTGILLCVPTLCFILDRLPVSIRNSILSFILKLEFSKPSKYVFRTLGGLHVIIGKK